MSSAEPRNRSEAEFARLTDPHRRELLVHCYRMLGSYHDAEDLVQETYLRAWRGFAQFEGRASVRTWLYRIATNACLSARSSSGRRLMPSGLGGPSDGWDPDRAERRYDIPWLEPLPDGDDDPASVAVRRETTRLAFVAALQELPARQRAALLLRDVLDWPAADVADLLDMTVAAVNSALQRARAHLAGERPSEEEVAMTTDIDAQVLERYVSAFLDVDVDAFAALLREDVEIEMPPIPMWFRGRQVVADFYAERVLRPVRRKFVPLRANGCVGTAVYQEAEDGLLRAHDLQVLETAEGMIARIYVFLEPRLFPAFGLPDVWPDD